jgi:hydrogenase maturation protease
VKGAGLNSTFETRHSREGSASVLIIGIGNADRGDDAVGLLAARQIAALGLAGVEIIESRGELSQLLELFKCHGTVFVIDAMSSGNATGTILRFQVGEAVLPQSLSSGSTHVLGLAVAIDLANTLNQLPARLQVYGIVGQNFAPGSPLSSAVEKALPELVGRISKEIQAIGKT